jgi:hypothetical protein
MWCQAGEGTCVHSSQGTLQLALKPSIGPELELRELVEEGNAIEEWNFTKVKQNTETIYGQVGRARPMMWERASRGDILKPHHIPIELAVDVQVEREGKVEVQGTSRVVRSVFMGQMEVQKKR